MSPGLTMLDWIVLGLAFTVLLTAVLAPGFRTTLSLFLTADRKVTTFFLLLTSLATFIGAGLIIGGLDLGYTRGILVGVLGLAFANGFVWVAILAPRVRRITGEHDLRTLPQFLEWRYSSSSRRTQLAAGTVNLIAYLFLAALQLVGLSVVLGRVFGLPEVVVIVAVGVIVSTYTSWSGLRAEFITDYVQFFIMAGFLLILVPILVMRTGGASMFWNNVMHAPGPSTTELVVVGLLGFLIWGPSLLGSMDVWQRLIAAHDEKVARKTMLWAALIITVVFGICMIAGMGSPRVQSTKSPAIDLLLNAFPVGGLRGLAVAGLLAAMMSTADTMILVAGVSLANDLLPVRRADGPELLRRNRVCVLACAMVSIVMALLLKDVLTLIGGALSSLAILVPATVGGLCWSRASERGAFWSIVVGAGVLYIMGIVLAVVAPQSLQLAVVPAALMAGGAFVVLRQRRLP